MVRGAARDRPWRSAAVASSDASLGIAQHPDVLAAAAALHRDDFRMRVGGEARKPAGHDPVAVRCGNGIDADAERARRKAVGVLGVPDGRLRKGQMFLGDEGVRARAHARDQRRALLGVEVAAEHGAELLIRKGRLDHQTWRGWR